MDDKQICGRLRKAFDKPAFVLLVYYGIMNALVMTVAFVDILVTMLTSPGMGLDAALESVMQNGWGYILATLIGAAILLIWKKPRFCFREIWKQSKKMTLGSFSALLSIFVSGQALFQLLAAGLEWLFSLFDMSILESIQMASFTADSISMFLYVALLAPVFEEILFRGLILRSLQPYGKKFSILASAFLFGIFHGNLVQSPFAFAVGLVLGYTAVEYSIIWSIVLHMINNFVLGDALPRLMQILPDWTGELIWFVIIWGSAVGAMVILLVKRKAVADYFRNGKIHPLCIRSFFTAPGVLVLTGFMAVNMVLTLLLQLLA